MQGTGMKENKVHGQFFLNFEMQGSGTYTKTYSVFFKYGQYF